MAALLAVSVARLGLACSTAFVGAVVVGPNFRVQAKDRGRPVKSVPIKLSVDSVVKYQAVTDNDGIAQFDNLPPGAYFLIAGPEPGFADAQNIQVNAELPERTIPVRWPNATPLVTASLKGTLNLWEQQPSLSLELLEPLSGRVLKSSDTDEHGAFDIPEIAPGLYLLRVMPPGGLIPVEVDPNAARDRLDLDLEFDSCGLHYTDHKQCPQSDLHLRHLEGRLIDAFGAGLAYREILLRDAGDKLVKRIQTEGSGDFFSLDVADGTYQLVVQENGFTPVRRTVTIDPNGASSPLEVQLGRLGLCSSATTR